MRINFWIFLLLRLSLSSINLQSFPISSIFNDTTHDAYGGYLNATQNSTARIFYQLWSIEGSKIQNNAPLIVWFQGGPGCSGFTGSLLESGPYYVRKDNSSKNYTLIPNNNSWAKLANVLYIDQPIAVGYSPQGDSRIPNTTMEASVQVLNFFKEFFKVYGYLKSNPLYIAGESYGGHYVPAFATEMMKAGYKIAGAIIGDGWVDPFYQGSMSDFLLGSGVISKMRYETYQEMENAGYSAIFKKDYVLSSHYFDTISGEVPTNISVTNISGVDYLNYREYGPTIDDSAVVGWLNEQSTREAFNVDKSVETFETCKEWIYKLFVWDDSQSFAGNFTSLIEGTNVLLYSGQNDIEENTANSYKWLSQIDWKGREDFENSNKRAISGFERGGFVKKSNNLSFVQINNAGHLVPADQPSMAFEMLKKWLNNSL